MSLIHRFLCCLLLTFTTLLSHTAFAEDKISIPILVYHNLSPTVPGSMNLTPDRVESQLKWIKDNGYTVIPLKDAVAYLQGKRTSLPPKPVVITADDGWESDYTYLVPLIRKYNMPLTLFIYPQTISTGKHALTWDQLKELQKIGLIDIQGHTYSHPNFKHAKKQMSPAAYEKFVHKELAESKQLLEQKLGIKVTLLAWPFGIYDPYLEKAAADAGYDMAFTIDYRKANRTFRPMAQPRFMIVDSESMKTFAMIVGAKGL